MGSFRGRRHRRHQLLCAFGGYQLPMQAMQEQATAGADGEVIQPAFVAALEASLIASMGSMSCQS